MADSVSSEPQSSSMFHKLASVEARFEELESRLADPDLGNRPGEFRKLSQEHSSLQELVAEYRRYKGLQSELRSNKELLGEKDAEIVALDDRTLKDLGLHRSEIESVVYGRETARARPGQTTALRQSTGRATAGTHFTRRQAPSIEKSAA